MTIYCDKFVGAVVLTVWKIIIECLQPTKFCNFSQTLRSSISESFGSQYSKCIKKYGHMIKKYGLQKIHFVRHTQKN